MRYAALLILLLALAWLCWSTTHYATHDRTNCPICQRRREQRNP